MLKAFIWFLLFIGAGFPSVLTIISDNTKWLQNQWFLVSRAFPGMAFEGSNNSLTSGVGVFYFS